MKYFSDKAKWEKYFHFALYNWQNFNIFYHDHYQPDQLHIVRYENLKKNLGWEMKNIMNFLNLTIDNSVESCVMKKQTGSFKRPKSNIDFRKFLTKSQYKDIKKIKKNVYTKLGLIS